MMILECIKTFVTFIYVIFGIVAFIPCLMSVMIFDDPKAITSFIVWIEFSCLISFPTSCIFSGLLGIIKPYFYLLPFVNIIIFLLMAFYESIF